jgi:hypothetical protein
MNEYLYEHFMNTFMNTFLREMNTMNTFWVFNYLFNKYTKLYNYTRKCVYVRKVFIVFINRVKVFIKVFIKCSQNIHFWEVFE